ncbi:hypothetical protein K490DRAFT_55050 [Saccharata proteae CBS 121410]|uniref:Uncharacterized protein n=1 Tax=Saccharata proteae CBS 121410 TaxID=1314787 RepID=A0A6A5YC28_9PEZI|nr:hypothetical protein K490DRAFT_55050 [Saccharata proteae CBS 121410]
MRQVTQGGEREPRSLTRQDSDRPGMYHSAQEALAHEEASGFSGERGVNVKGVMLLRAAALPDLSGILRRGWQHRVGHTGDKDAARRYTGGGRPRAQHHWRLAAASGSPWADGRTGQRFVAEELKTARGLAVHNANANANANACVGRLEDASNGLNGRDGVWEPLGAPDMQCFYLSALCGVGRTLPHRSTTRSDWQRSAARWLRRGQSVWGAPPSPLPGGRLGVSDQHGLTGWLLAVGCESFEKMLPSDKPLNVTTRPERRLIEPQQSIPLPFETRRAVLPHFKLHCRDAAEPSTCGPSSDRDSAQSTHQEF